MEDKVIKQIKTSCPFPLLIYSTSIKYNEVRKASGIAYILLELIEKSAGSKEKISDVLLKFGIPSNLHYIFGNELAGLVGTEIISTKYGAAHFRTPRYFSQIQIGEISLTDKGRKMFREGAIPTGAEKTKVKDIFFDPVRRKYDITFSLPHSDISTSCLGDDFIDKIDLDISGMGDYINANPTKMGLKAEERIVSFETEEPRREATKQDENLTISITNNGVEFKFATSDENAFFNKYYSSVIMKDVMLIKTKYKFYDINKTPVAVPTVRLEDLNATTLYIPDDFAKQINKPCKIFVGRNTFGYERSDGAIKTESKASAKLLTAMDANAEFALLDDSGCKYYRTVNVVMPCKQFGDLFEMQLLAENTASPDDFRNLVRGIFGEYRKKAFDAESGKVVTFAAEVLHAPELFEDYANGKLSEVNTVDEKIAVLLKLNDAFKKSSEWVQFFKDTANALFADSVKEIKLDNMIYKNTVLSPLRSAMGMSDMNYIASFSQELKESEEPTLVYQALETAGFSVPQILSVVNVVEIYIRAALNRENIATDTELATKYNAVKVNLWKLNDMLGIESLTVYTIKEDYNVDDFFNAYSTFISACKAVEKYRQYSPKNYEYLQRYAEIYEPIHDLLAIERTASSHPERITQKYVEEQISRGKYKDAICDLLVKLQFDLRKLLKADSAVPANELIDAAKKDGYIDRNQADALHKLRICRNAFQHAERNQIEFDKEIITQWKDIVFSIVGGKK